MLRKIIIALAVCLPLTACETMKGSSTDIYSPAVLKQNLKVGVTTPAEVRSIYGAPESTSEGPNGPSLWTYQPSKTGANSAIQSAASMLGFGSAASGFVDNRYLHVHFDNNRVSSYSLSDSK
jgi:predicted small secreted protein